jgi:hypothetical protein
VFLFLIYLYILDINPFDSWQRFSPILWDVSWFWKMFPLMWKSFNLILFHLSFLAIIAWANWVLFRKKCYVCLYLEVFAYIFLWLFQSFRSYIKVFDLLFFVHGDIGIWFQSCSCGHPVFPVPRIEEATFSVTCVLHLCQESDVCSSMNLFWGCIFIALCVSFHDNIKLFLLLYLCSMIWGQVL